MSEGNRHAASKLFPAVRFKALDYVFETSTTLKITLDLLALPTPYLTGTSDLYPHNGNVPDVTYRRPWIRVNMISSSEISVSDSVLDDLGGKERTSNPIERFIEKDDVDIIPSSNPDSPVNFDQDQYICSLKELQINDICQESFLGCIFSQQPEREDIDHLLLEDIIATYNLAKFRRHLPSLKAKLSRLKPLPVSDPLLSTVSEDIVFKKLTSTEKYLHFDSIIDHICEDIQEMFDKETFLEDEFLLTPPIITTLQSRPQTNSLFPKILASPEPLDDAFSVLHVLEKLSFLGTSVDICQCDGAEEARKQRGRSEDLIQSEFAGCAPYPAALELETILSPISKKVPSYIDLCTAHLQKEDISPFCTQSFLSLEMEKQMEAEVWNAEKYPDFIAAFLLPERLICYPAVDFQPLQEALCLVKLEKQSFSCTDDKLELHVDTRIPELVFGFNQAFIEKFRLVSLSETAEEKEEFRELLPKHVEAESILLNYPVESNFNKKTSYVENKDKKLSAIICTQEEIVEERCSVSEVNLTAQTVAHPPKGLSKLDQNVQSFDLTLPDVRESETRLEICPLEKMSDPLFEFMMLRSQLGPPAGPTSPSSAKSTATEAKEQSPVKEQQQPPPVEMQTCDRRPAYTSITVARDACSEQKAALLSELSPQQKQPSRVVQVQATDSQQRAYNQLMAFAQPLLSSSRLLELKFPSLGNFHSLAPDQTHFLLKQQERALCRTPAQHIKLVQEQEFLFNQAARIHMLVTFKELLLKCGLSVAVEYLAKAAEAYVEQGLKELLKKLQIILFLSQNNQEFNFKLMELQQLTSEWLHSRKGDINAEKMLIILSVECAESKSTIINCLTQTTGAAVTSVCPTDDEQKLDGASVVSSVCNSDCAVMCEQHIGPDFPWTCFSLVAEFDHPGMSPWAKICSEQTTEESIWSLEDKVPFVLLVTENLLRSPLLLQTLESSFCVTVLERSHSPSLQMLGGTHNYVVITVDEATVIIIQEEEELCQERAGEGLVMRLTALSLQYRCCWLILHCHHSQRGGFSGEAFNNLVLVYSSLVLFSKKSEDLDVKVLIVSDVFEMAKFINQICFKSLLCSDSDPVSYLNRDWMTVMPSQEEEFLSQFPCISPLIGQLMLSRAPSLQWILNASFSQLHELLPEVPDKVLKLFSDITSLYMRDTDPGQSQRIPADSSQQTDTSLSPQTYTDTAMGPGSFSEEHNNNFLYGATSIEDTFFETEAESADFRLDIPRRSFCSPDIESSWTRSSLWSKEETLPLLSHRAGALGRVVKRVSEGFTPETPSIHIDENFFGLDSGVSRAQTAHPPVCSDLQPPHSHHVAFRTSSPADVAFDQFNNRLSWTGVGEVSSSFGSSCWRGQERKRTRDSAGHFEPALTPLKRGKLSCERVLGRNDGQMRLRLF